jgi:hypothetical protein
MTGSMAERLRRIRIGRAEPLFQKPPVDRPAEPGKRMVHIDDLVQASSEKIVLPTVPPLLRTHPVAPCKPCHTQRMMICPAAQFASFQGIEPAKPAKRQAKRSKRMT